MILTYVDQNHSQVNVAGATVGDRRSVAAPFGGGGRAGARARVRLRFRTIPGVRTEGRRSFVLFFPETLNIWTKIFPLGALFPNIFNLATNSLISADATCGQYGREEFCKLVEHVRKSNDNR